MTGSVAHHEMKAQEAGLTGERLLGRTSFRIALAFAGAKQPPCRVIPKLKELDYDIVGPVPLGDGVHELIRESRPDIFNIRIDEPNPETYGWIGRIWREHHLPVIVVTSSPDVEICLDAVHAGAFAITREDADISCIRAAITLAAQRGSALRDAQIRVAQLEKNLANRRLVEQAKWALIEREGITEPEAHTRLQTAARNARIPLADVAQRVIDGGPVEG